MSNSIRTEIREILSNDAGICSKGNQYIYGLTNQIISSFIKMVEGEQIICNKPNLKCKGIGCEDCKVEGRNQFISELISELKE